MRRKRRNWTPILSSYTKSWTFSFFSTVEASAWLSYSCGYYSTLTGNTHTPGPQAFVDWQRLPSCPPNAIALSSGAHYSTLPRLPALWCSCVTVFWPRTCKDQPPWSFLLPLGILRRMTGPSERAKVAAVKTQVFSTPCRIDTSPWPHLAVRKAQSTPVTWLRG